MQSRTAFLPDSRLMVRTSGAVALTSRFNSAAFDLARLAAFWHTDEVSLSRVLQFAVSIEAITLSGAESYEFFLEVDDNSSFTSATKVASQIISSAAHDGTLPVRFDLNVDRAILELSDVNVAYLRFCMTPTGVAETGSVTAVAAAHDGDTVTIDDGVHTAVVFTFGDGTGGTVDKGLTATDTAQNLKAAIAAAVLANNLGVTATGASTVLALTNTAGNTGGSIATTSSGRLTRVDWSGGLNASIQFWAFVRGEYACGA